MDTKIHFRTRSDNLCGRGSIADSTYTEYGVTCKHCLRKLPAWKVERARIAEYDESHIAVITFRMPLAQWHGVIEYAKRKAVVNALLGGLSREIVALLSCVMESKIEIIEK